MLPRGLRIGILDVLPRGPLKLNFGRAFQRSDGLNLDVLPRGPMVWNLGRASQRSKDLNFGRASQRSDE